MIQLKKAGIGLLVIILAIGVSMLTQAYISVHAAETIIGTSNEIITIKTTDGLPVNTDCLVLSYSSDGNVVLFISSATNLPSANGSRGLYVYNIKQDATQRVDVSTNGTPADHTYLTASSLSETGRYVTFSSNSTNLLDGLTVGNALFYKRDTQLGTTTYVVSSANFTASTGSWEYNLGTSNDGRFILMSSRYINGDYPYPYRINIGDNISGSYQWTALTSGAYSDPEGNKYSSKNAGGMSCDGSFAVYMHTGIIKLIDLRRGSDITVSASGNDSQSPIISCNGRYILYVTRNRVDISPTPSGINTDYHLVRYDRITDERIYVDRSSTGAFSTGYPANGGAPFPNMFKASVADTGDVAFKYNDYTYLKHLNDGSGTLEPIAKNTSGTAVNMAAGVLSGDGRYIFFQADPYSIGLASSASTSQIIRVKTKL